MAIDIKNINEITFTQSFRGYNTEEVDDFLDALYEEASQNNREIDELKKKLKALESGEGGGGMNQEEAYAVIANAQEEADKIVEAARQKAHAMIVSAENQISEGAGMPAPAAAPSAGVNAAALGRLKDVLRETYEKQIAAINELSEVRPEPVVAAKPAEPKSEIPSVSFSGITKTINRKIPAERDILSEINAIGLDGFDASRKGSGISYDLDEVESTGLGIGMQKPEESDASEPAEPAEPESPGLAFSFAEHTEPEEEEMPLPEEPFQENLPEDPDDIIAQILRDNNRN